MLGRRDGGIWLVPWARAGFVETCFTMGDEGVMCGGDGADDCPSLIASSTAISSIDGALHGCRVSFGIVVF